MRILHIGDDHAALRPCGLTLYSDALMRAQAARGHAVSYLYSGRHYPRLRGPRLRRGRLGPIRTYEFVNSPNHAHWELGTRHPLVDVAEPAGEAAFLTALRAERPDVVHVHELSRLPGSLLDLAREAGVKVVMTLHDYKPLCPSVRLLDADGQRCRRLEVGQDCARDCAGAPEGPRHLIEWSLSYDLARAKQAVPGLRRIDFSPLESAVGPLRRRAAGPAAPPAPLDPGGFQRRRQEAVRRLSRCDRLLAPSPRVAEVYAALGVDPTRLSVQTLTLPHLEQLRPARGPEVGAPLTFAALGAAAHPSKGSRALADAVEALAGRPFELHVHGRVEPAVRERLERSPAVRLCGPYDLAELDARLDAADMGLMPSIWEETHGFSGVEQLAKGLPLIGSALGGIPAYVREGETGWLNHSAEGEGLAALMARAIDDPGEVVRLRRSVLAARQELVTPMAVHVAQVEAHYAELVDRRPAHAASRRRRFARDVAGRLPIAKTHP